MKLVLFIYLFVLSIYIGAAVTGCLITNSSDAGELSLMKRKRGQKTVDAYKGVQGACVGLSGIVWILLIYSIYRDISLKLAKAIIFVTLFLGFVTLIASIVQYELVGNVKLETGDFSITSEADVLRDLTTFKNLHAESPMYNGLFSLFAFTYVAIIYLAYNINNNNKLKLFEGAKKTTKKKKSDLDRIIDEESK